MKKFVTNVSGEVVAPRVGDTTYYLREQDCVREAVLESIEFVPDNKYEELQFRCSWLIAGLGSYVSFYRIHSFKDYYHINAFFHIAGLGNIYLNERDAKNAEYNPKDVDYRYLDNKENYRQLRTYDLASALRKLGVSEDRIKFSKTKYYNQHALTITAFRCGKDHSVYKVNEAGLCMCIDLDGEFHIVLDDDANHFTLEEAEQARDREFQLKTIAFETD